MKKKCPYCSPWPKSSSDSRNIIRNYGSFYRKSDRKKVLRFFCTLCLKHFSSATHSMCYKQKKRQLNHKVAHLMCAEVSQREGARFLKINRKTFIRKFVFMGENAEKDLANENRHMYPKAKNIQFDDMETFEHTKCKPVSILLAVEENTRRILHFEVARMPAKGLLAEISRKKYGFRKDERKEARKRFFTELQNVVDPRALIRSDQNPHYPQDVKKYLPESEHIVYKGRKGAVVGQGELKKGRSDPLFYLNHTCAVIRARASRLIRKTWCTTKKPERLRLHLALVCLHHNRTLKLQQSKGPG